MKTTIVAITLAILAWSTSAVAEGKKLVVVVAKGSSMTSISRADLKHCFSGDTVSGGGKTLVPFNFATATAEREGFDKAVLGMSPDEVGQYWINRKVRGQSAAPRSLPSNAHVAKVVAKFPGAIGYLPADALTADVKAITVDGVEYTDAKYNITAR
jgi:hypothetical protein